jgi:UrcA family protein
MHKLIISTFAVLSLVSIADPARAETVTVTVPYSDLDLASPSGMETLNGRIELAARHICGSADIRNLKDVADQKQCLREAAGSAARQVTQLDGRRAGLAFNVSIPHRR